MHHRPMIASLHRRARLGVSALALVACAPLSSRALAEPGRTPEPDNVCPWGRLADGHGRLVRCLTHDEAARLHEATPAASPAKSAPAAAAPPAPSDAPAAGSSAEAARPKDVTTPIAPASSAADAHEGKEAARPAGPADTAPSTTPPADVAPLDVDIGSVVADSGSLPDAQKSLRKARDRIAACVEKSGGLSAEHASVELRFLVQGLGKAEGVSVKKHHGLTEAAAKCVANVVDRRFVGYPDEPAVGVTVVVTLSKKKR